MYAFQSGLSFARLGVPLLSPDFAVGQSYKLTLGKFGFAVLPADATVERVTFSIDHAIIRSIALASGQVGSAAFEWRAVRLLGADGAVLATANDVSQCSGGNRAWLAENCRGSGNCLATATFRRWSPAPPTREKLASCDFAVEVEFARLADEGSGPFSDDSNGFGLRANGLALTIAANSTVPLAAVLGPALVTVEYKSASQRAAARINAPLAPATATMSAIIVNARTDACSGRPIATFDNKLARRRVDRRTECAGRRSCTSACSLSRKRRQGCPAGTCAVDPGQCASVAHTRTHSVPKHSRRGRDCDLFAIRRPVPLAGPDERIGRSTRVHWHGHCCR
jgi:hypothetical protein